MNGDKDKAGRDDAFEERAAALFRDSVDGLDGATRSRLNRARQQAVKAAQPVPGVFTNGWIPAGAAAAVAAIAIVTWNANDPASLPAAPTVATDFEILMDAEDLEMLEELEFYSWMELEGDAAAGDEHVG